MWGTNKIDHVCECRFRQFRIRATQYLGLTASVRSLNGMLSSGKPSPLFGTNCMTPAGRWLDLHARLLEQASHSGTDSHCVATSNT